MTNDTPTSTPSPEQQALEDLAAMKTELQTIASLLAMLGAAIGRAERVTKAMEDILASSDETAEAPPSHSSSAEHVDTPEPLRLEVRAKLKGA